MYVRITRINRDRGVIFDETKERIESREGLFKTLQQQFGRCVSHCFVDRTDGTPRKIGWVFEKRESYDDSNKSFIQETWVAVEEINYCF